MNHPRAQPGDQARIRVDAPLRPLIRMCLRITVAMTGVPLAFGVGAAQEPAVLRCGWFDNPSPGNATLTDRDGEWLVGQQGGHQADGDWPTFRRGQWVRTGAGSAGYGCACLRVQVEAERREVRRIVSTRAVPLAKCRGDPRLKGTEPENPLADRSAPPVR